MTNVNIEKLNKIRTALYGERNDVPLDDENLISVILTFPAAMVAAIDGKVDETERLFLLNISDGLPNIHSTSYNFNTAINHTSKVIRQYKKDNIGVLSYYIHDVWDKTQKAEGTFAKMYGKNAKYIDVNNISLVGKTINNMLLSNTIKVF